jgi:hypothetical protein
MYGRRPLFAEAGQQPGQQQRAGQRARTGRGVQEAEDRRPPTERPAHARGRRRAWPIITILLRNTG